MLTSEGSYITFSKLYKNIWGENVIQISEDNLFEEIEDLYQVIELRGLGPGHFGNMGINNFIFLINRKQISAQGPISSYISVMFQICFSLFAVQFVKI